MSATLEEHGGDLEASSPSEREGKTETGVDNLLVSCHALGALALDCGADSGCCGQNCTGLKPLRLAEGLIALIFRCTKLAKRRQYKRVKAVVHAPCVPRR